MAGGSGSEATSLESNQTAGWQRRGCGLDQSRVITSRQTLPCANGDVVQGRRPNQVRHALANIWQYRVKRVGDSQEHAVSEQQLTKVGSQTLTKVTVVDVRQDTQRIRNARAATRARVTARQGVPSKRSVETSSHVAVWTCLPQSW